MVVTYMDAGTLAVVWTENPFSNFIRPILTKLGDTPSTNSMAKGGMLIRVQYTSKMVHRDSAAKGERCLLMHRCHIDVLSHGTHACHTSTMTLSHSLLKGLHHPALFTALSSNALLPIDSHYKEIRSHTRSRPHTNLTVLTDHVAVYVLQHLYVLPHPRWLCCLHPEDL